MQPPGSPPRPTCYNQQLPYNPDPALYYNIPMYGPIEGPPLYTDPLDISGSGPYVEVSIFCIQFCLIIEAVLNPILAVL